MTAVEWLMNQFENTDDKELVAMNIDVWFKIAKEMEVKQSEDYLTFGVNCVKFDYPVLHFKDFIKL